MADNNQYQQPPNIFKSAGQGILSGPAIGREPGWKGAVANMGQALLGGVLEGVGQQQEIDQRAESMRRLTNALMTQDFGAIASDPVYGGMAPDLVLKAMERRAAQEDAALKRKEDLRFGLLEKGKNYDFETGSVGAVPGYYDIDIDVEGKKAGASAAGRLSQELKYSPQIRGAELAVDAAMKPGIAYGEAMARNRADYNPMIIEAKEAKERPGQEDSLRKEFNATPAVRDLTTVNTYFNQMTEAMSDRGPGSDLSFIYGAMKIVDPNSVVREGEAATAENSGGIPEAMRSSYNKLLGGATLTDEQRAGLLGVAKRFRDAQLQQYEPIRQGYESTASARKLDPSKIFYTPKPEPSDKLIEKGEIKQIRKQLSDQKRSTITVNNKLFDVSEIDDASLLALKKAGKL